MKRILSEKNFAAVLFVLVLMAFAFAHEDSKKRDVFYNASYNHPSTTYSAVSAFPPQQKINTAQQPEVAKQ